MLHIHFSCSSCFKDKEINELGQLESEIPEYVEEMMAVVPPIMHVADWVVLKLSIQILV